MTWCENRGDMVFPLRQRKDLKMYYRCHLLLLGNLWSVSQDKGKRCPTLNTSKLEWLRNVFCQEFGEETIPSLCWSEEQLCNSAPRLGRKRWDIWCTSASPPYHPTFPQLRHIWGWSRQSCLLMEIHTAIPEDSAPASLSMWHGALRMLVIL